MGAREDVLRRLRDALRDVPEADALPEGGPVQWQTAPSTDEQRIARFADCVRDACGEIHMLESGAQATAWLLDHARETGGSYVFSAQPLCVEAAGALRSCGIDACIDAGWESSAQRIRALEGAQAGVSVAACGAADCGALFIVSSPGHGRALSLLPLEHIVLMAGDALQADLRDCGACLDHQGSGLPPAAVTIIGGPSKTADIEKVLVTGVHGPKRLIVLLIHTTSRSLS